MSVHRYGSDDITLAKMKAKVLSARNFPPGSYFIFRNGRPAGQKDVEIDAIDRAVEITDEGYRATVIRDDGRVICDSGEAA